MNQSIKHKVSSELQSLQGDFDIIKTQSIYAMSLIVNVGASDIKVSFEDLGFDADDAKKKKLAQLKPTTLVVFPELRTYGNKLSAIKKELQDKYMISGSKRWWFVLESRIDELSAAIQSELIPTVDSFREEILSYYGSARDSYRLRVIEAFAGKFDLTRQDELVHKYMAKFPSPDDVADGFYVSLDGPIRISSILEDAAVAEKASILVLHKQWRESIMNSLQGSLRDAEEEIYDVVTKLLERMEDKPAGGLSELARRKFEEIANRLTLLVDFNQSLEEIASNVPLLIAKDTLEIVQDYNNLTDDGMSPRDLCKKHILFTQKLDGFKQNMKGKIDLQTKGGGGHRSVGKWMMSNEA